LQQHWLLQPQDGSQQVDWAQQLGSQAQDASQQLEPQPQPQLNRPRIESKRQQP
jgi:hypothetical protein